MGHRTCLVQVVVDPEEHHHVNPHFQGKMGVTTNKAEKISTSIAQHPLQKDVSEDYGSTMQLPHNNNASVISAVFIVSMLNRGKLAEDFCFGTLAEPSPASLPFFGTKCTNESCEGSGLFVARGPVPGFWIRRCLHETYRKACSLCTVRDLRAGGSFCCYG